MRFSFQLSLNPRSDSFFLPTDYRIGLASLFKEALNPENREKISEIYEKYYGDKTANRMKPFSFASYIPEVRASDQKLFFPSGEIQVHFTSDDYEMILMIYNGLIAIHQKNTAYPFYQYHARPEKIFLHPKKTITGEEACFKTLSPLVVNQIENKKAFAQLEFLHPLFRENLYHSIKTLYGSDFTPFDFQPLKMKTAGVPHYGKRIPVNQGTFLLKAPAPVLQKIYDAGIGARRSQGFGMLEVMG